MTETTRENREAWDRQVATSPTRNPLEYRARFAVGDRVVPRGHGHAMEVVRVRGTVYLVRDSEGREHVAHDGELISESDAPWARKDGSDV